MVDSEFANRLEAASEVSEIYDLVKEAVFEVIGRKRGGLMLGMAELGVSPQGFVGAYHQMGSNLIVMNSTLLKRIEEKRPELLKYYTFHLLLHEYIHSLGFGNEEKTRGLVYSISVELFGESHVVTQIAEGLDKIIPDLTYPSAEWNPPSEAYITLISGFDKDNTRYIG